MAHKEYVILYFEGKASFGAGRLFSGFAQGQLKIFGKLLW